MVELAKLEKISPFKWRLPRRYKPFMRVDGIIFASEDLLHDREKGTDPLDQVANAAALPGIVRASYAMPDIHYG